MRLDDLAFKNFKRRKRKVVFPLLGIVIAVAAAVGLYTIISEATVSLADTFDEIGANVLIVPQEETALSYGGSTILGVDSQVSYLNTNDVIKINTIAQRDSIAFVAPKILAAAQLRAEEVLLVGVDFPQELQMKRWWRYYGEKPRGVKDVLLGSRVAEKFDLKPGDNLTLAEEELTVTAVLAEQGSEEDDFIFMQLLTVQDMFNLDGKLSFIEVAAYCTSCPLDEIVIQISDVLPNARVSALAAAVKSREDVIGRFFSFALLTTVLLFATAALIVFITMLAAIRERTREIGILRSLGYRRRHIFEIILTETALIGLFGGIFGYLAGILLARSLAPYLLAINVRPALNPIVMISSLAGALILALAAGSYPAYKAASVDPIEALHYI